MSVSSVSEESPRPTIRPTLEIMPSEVRDHIFSYLPQESLYCLLLTSPALAEGAITHLYFNPIFPTTYRFAQFVTTVSHSRRYADMVRVYELSDRKDAENHANGFASWREWRYRGIPLYAARPPPKRLIKPKTRPYKGTHPGFNDLFNKTNICMPVGFVIHVLAACRKIRKFKLTFSALTNDDLIESPSYPSSAVSNLVFGSDIARSWTQGSADVELVQPNFLIQYLPGLLELEAVQIQHAPWLTREDVHGILRSCPRLRKVDFRHSGKLTRDQALVISGKTLKWEIPWAMEGSRKECAATVLAGMASWSLATVSSMSESETHRTC